MTAKESTNKNDSHLPKPPPQVLYMRIAQKLNDGVETNEDLMFALKHSEEISKWRERLKRNAEVSEKAFSLKQQLQSRFGHKVDPD